MDLFYFHIKHTVTKNPLLNQRIWLYLSQKNISEHIQCPRDSLWQLLKTDKERVIKDVLQENYKDKMQLQAKYWLSKTPNLSDPCSRTPNQPKCRAPYPTCIIPSQEIKFSHSPEYILFYIVQQSIYLR